MSDEPGENQYQDLAVSGLPTDSNPADRIAGESEELERIKRVGKQRAENLRDAGFNTIVDIRNADVEEISTVENVGENTAEKIIAGDVSELTGVGDKRAAQLREAGFQTATDIVEADHDELENISGIGDTLVTRFKIEAAGYEVNDQALTAEEPTNRRQALTAEEPTNKNQVLTAEEPSSYAIEQSDEETNIRRILNTTDISAIIRFNSLVCTFREFYK